MPWETYTRLQQLGYNFLLSFFGTFFIHASMSWMTQEGWVPDPYFSILIANIHRCLYGSDTGLYDVEGRVDMHNVMALFGDPNDPGLPTLSADIVAHPALLEIRKNKAMKASYDFWDIWNLTELNKKIFDFYGYLISKLMWFYLWILADYRVTKSDILSQLDGAYFQKKLHVNPDH